MPNIEDAIRYAVGHDLGPVLSLSSGEAEPGQAASIRLAEHAIFRQAAQRAEPLQKRRIRAAIGVCLVAARVGPSWGNEETGGKAMAQIIIEAANEDITELARVLKEAGWKLDFGRAVGVSDADYVIMRGGQDKTAAAAG